MEEWRIERGRCAIWIHPISDLLLVLHIIACSGHVQCCISAALLPQQTLTSCPPASGKQWPSSSKGNSCRISIINSQKLKLRILRLQVTNGSVEHDIHRELPGSSTKVTLLGPVDSRCPQNEPFGVVRCRGHQHIGILLAKLDY